MRPLRFSGEPYRGINTIMLWLAAEGKGYTASIWMTFHQAGELKGAVRRGEKSTLTTSARSPTPRRRTSSSTGVRRYGWAPRSERLIAAGLHGNWRSTTFVAGLRSTGLVAPLVLDGTMSGLAFLAYVQQFLAPTLRPGDVVVMDNSPPIRWRASRTPSEPPVPACFICHPTHPP